MAVHFVIASHGRLAEGMIHALTFIGGQGFENVHVISAFTETDEFPEVSIDRCFAEIPEEDQIVAVTDLKYGSVNQMFFRRLQDRKLHLITGMNLGLLLGLFFQGEEEICAESLRILAKEAREGICYMNDELEEFAEEEEDVDDFLGGG